MAQNGTAWRQMAQMTLKHFPWVYNMIICHVGPPWALFRGPRGRIMAEISTKNGPLWPKMALYDQKWPFMTQNIPAWPQMALKHFSWVYYMILCHAGLPWGHFRSPHGPRGTVAKSVFASGNRFFEAEFSEYWWWIFLIWRRIFLILRRNFPNELS